MSLIQQLASGGPTDTLDLLWKALAVFVVVLVVLVVVMEGRR